MATPTYIEVGQDVADAFDTFKAKQARCRELDRQKRPHDKEMRDAKQVLTEAIGRNERAKLPDGREICRTDDERHRKAQPASDYTITDFIEAAILLVCVWLTMASATAAQPPASVTMPNGETFYVVGHESTDVAVHSGSWSNPRTWADRSVPTLTDNVWIPPHTQVLMHGDLDCRNIVCAGGMQILHGMDLSASTIMILPGGKCSAGAHDDRVAFTIHWFGEEFEAGDAGQIGNGLIAFDGGDGHDCLEWYGVPGDERESAPDDPVIVTSGFYAESFRSDAATDPPDGDRVFDLGGSIRMISHGPLPHHAIIVHGTAIVEGMSLDGFGRTNKSLPLGADNPNGRWAMHFHRGPEDRQSVLRWVNQFGSAGWGLVNHSSNVLMEDCLTAGNYGAGFVAQAGNGVGVFRRCTAIGTTSTEIPNSWFDADGNWHARAVNDRWHSGEGFAFSSAGIACEQCRSIDCNVGFAWMCNPYSETIGGVTGIAKFADGTLPHRAQLAPQTDLSVSGFVRSAFEVKWIQPTLPFDGVMTNLIAENGVRSTNQNGVYNINNSSRAIYHGYCTGINVDGLSVNNVDIGYETIDGPALGGGDVNIVNPHMVDVHVAFRNKRTVDNDFVFSGGQIEADEIGVECTASNQPGGARWHLDGMTITAPTPLQFVGAPTGFDAVYLDGVLHEWP